MVRRLALWSNIALLALVLGGVATVAMARRAEAQIPVHPTADVIISNRSFGPPITIQAGTSVFWKNVDTTDHTVTHDLLPPLFDVYVPAGEQRPIFFQFQGLYEYHCKIHPDMVSAVIVEGPVGEKPTPSPTPSATATATATPSPTATATASPTSTPTASATASPTQPPATATTPRAPGPPNTGSGSVAPTEPSRLPLLVLGAGILVASSLGAGTLWRVSRRR